MKSFKQFLSESVNIAGDFNGNLYIGIHIPPNNYLTAVVSSSSNMTAASASFIYVED